VIRRSLPKRSESLAARLKPPSATGSPKSESVTVEEAEMNRERGRLGLHPRVCVPIVARLCSAAVACAHFT